MMYTNSPLVGYTRLSPHHSGFRTHAIDRITIHHAVGQFTAAGICAVFCGARLASANYVLGYDGEVGLSVEEKNRSWCSSSEANDQRAVTIECADDSYSPYKMTDAAYARLIELCVDICKRNGKKKLLWLGNKTAALAYTPAADEMVMTVHRWFLATQCPGQWLMERMPEIAERVTKQLGGNPNPVNTCEIELPVLKLGSKGQSVKTLQTLLIAQKFSCGGWGADGDFGNGTLSAVRNFQTLRKLGADGVVGAKTWAELTKF